MAPPERPPAPRRGDFSSGMWKGAGWQEPGAAAARVQGVARRARQVRGRLPAAGSGREQLGALAAAPSCSRPEPPGCKGFDLVGEPAARRGRQGRRVEGRRGSRLDPGSDRGEGFLSPLTLLSGAFGSRAHATGPAMGEWVSIYPKQHYSRLTFSTSSVLQSAFRCSVLAVAGQGRGTPPGRF